MRTLLVTGTYPTKYRPSAGIFVRNQYQRLRRLASKGELFDLFCVYTRTDAHERSMPKVILAALRFLPYLLRRYDVVHVHFLSPLLFAGVLYKRLHPKTRLVLTVHGSGLKRLKFASKRVQQRYARALQRVDHIVAAGPPLVAPLKSLLGASVDQVLCAGVDEQHFFVEPDTQKEYDFIYVGSFETDKGLDILIDAFELLGDYEIRACIVGSGPLGRRLQRAGHNLNIDVFHDVPQRRLRHLYNQSRFLVFPSRGDGFGLVVSEAMYCGTPPIVFADSGAQYQVRHNENGLIYKPNTPEKLARTIADAFALRADAYDDLALAARHANRDVALADVGEELLALYRRLCAAPEVS